MLLSALHRPPFYHHNNHSAEGSLAVDTSSVGLADNIGPAVDILHAVRNLVVRNSAAHSFAVHNLEHHIHSEDQMAVRKASHSDMVSRIVGMGMRRSNLVRQVGHLLYALVVEGMESGLATLLRMPGQHHNETVVLRRQVALQRAGRVYSSC